MHCHARLQGYAAQEWRRRVEGGLSMQPGVGDPHLWALVAHAQVI